MSETGRRCADRPPA